MTLPPVPTFLLLVEGEAEAIFIVDAEALPRIGETVDIDGKQREVKSVVHRYHHTGSRPLYTPRIGVTVIVK